MKKNEAIKFRLSDEEKTELKKIAEHFDCGDLSSLLRVMCTRLIGTHNKPWQEVEWPLEFKVIDKEPLKLRANYSYTLVFEKGEPVEIDGGSFELSTRNEGFDGDPEDYVTDDYYWGLIYKAILEDLAWRCEKTYCEKPKEISIKIWKLFKWVDFQDESGQGWYSLMTPEGPVHYLEKHGLL